jgi:hypothetical protein
MIIISGKTDIDLNFVAITVKKKYVIYISVILAMAMDKYYRRQDFI